MVYSNRKSIINAHTNAVRNASISTSWKKNKKNIRPQLSVGKAKTNIHGLILCKEGKCHLILPQIDSFTVRQSVDPITCLHSC